MNSRGPSPQRSPRREEGACEGIMELIMGTPLNHANPVPPCCPIEQTRSMQELTVLSLRKMFSLIQEHSMRLLSAMQDGGSRSSFRFQSCPFCLSLVVHPTPQTCALWISSLGCFSGACWWERLNCWGPGSASDSRRLRPWAGLMATFSITASHKPSWYNVCP